MNKTFSHKVQPVVLRDYRYAVEDCDTGTILCVLLNLHPSRLELQQVCQSCLDTMYPESSMRLNLIEGAVE
jgi:hypothetical protein